MAIVIAVAAVALAAVALVGEDRQPTYGGYFDGNSTPLESNTVEAVVEKVSPSVVSITTETRSRVFGGGGSASGTGMIVTSSGYILTNKHVVSGASKVQVILEDGETYDAEVVGVDPLNDVAFVKIDVGHELPAVELGNSRTLKVGQPVMAIGNALGQYQNTVTQGVISGLSRSITAEGGDGVSENLTDMIQTDASINPGNSGGPLVNAAGQVIGINTAVSTSANGIGFAIPIGMVRGLLDNLIATGKVERAWLGVYYVPITPGIATEYDLPVRMGAYIFRDDGQSAVVSGSPADKAGIKSKDIIVKVGEHEVGSTGSLSALLAEYAVGQTAKLEVLRGGQTIALDLRLEVYSE